MTIDEVRKLYRRILDRLYQDRLYDAFLDISYLMQQNGFGEVFDKLHEQELNYSYLLQYRLDGYQDKDRDKVLSDMKRTLFQLADQAWSDWQSAFSSQWYYSQKRYRNINGQNKRDFAALSQLLSRCREDEHMLTEAASQDGVAQRLAEVRGQKEQLTGDFFLQLLFDEPWKEGDYARMPAHCQALDENGQALCVSALLLAVQQMFDEYKLLFLADLCDSSSPLVAMRALTALMLLMDQYQKRISGIPALTSRLSLLFDRPEIRAAASGIFAQLIRAKEAEQVSRRMKEEFLPEMNKRGSSIRQRLEDNKDQSQEDLKNDLEELFEDGGMSEKMMEFSKMQTEGEDVYLSTFSSLKFYPFFKEIYNWFLPFDPNHTAIASVFRGRQVFKGLDVPKVMTQSDLLCASDKYSFCLNLAQVPEQYRDQMSANMGADSEAFEEMMHMEQNGSRRLKAENITNLYIQDLYRFYKLFPSKDDFDDVFARPLDFYANPLTAGYFTSEEYRRRIAAMYLKKNHFVQALNLYRQLLEDHPADFDLLRQSAWCCQQIQDYESAVTYYERADLIRPDNAWVIKRLAACLRQLGRNEQALDCYRRAAALNPDNLSLCLNQGHCLMDLGRYSDALNCYYKAEFLFQGSPRIWRPVAWCLVLTGRYDQAEKYYDKLLAEEKPIIEDYLNAGHLKWLQGQLRRAVELYAQGVGQCKITETEFVVLLEQDLPLLKDLGISPADIPFVIDGFKYELVKWKI